MIQGTRDKEYKVQEIQGRMNTGNNEIVYLKLEILTLCQKNWKTAFIIMQNL